VRPARGSGSSVGDVNIIMLRNALFLGAVVFALAAAPAPSLAQDRLDPIAKKAKLGSRDRAEIAAEVADRAGRLAQVGTDPDLRSRARDRLIATARIKGATKEFLDVYSEACATELEPLTTREAFETGFDAVWVLVDLDHPRTAGALAAALKSAQAPTRLRAARGLQMLQKRIAADDKTCQVVCRALGEAGADEREETVLRVIYEAIDFGAEVKGGKLAEECARALNSILAGRVRRLKAGDRNETVDQPAVALAVRCFAGASEAQQKQLLANLTALLSHAVDRYFAADTAEGYLAALADVVKKTEAAIHDLMKASKGKPPNDTVAAAIGKSKNPKNEQPARTALKDLKTALQGDPWNIKFESSGPG